MKGYEQYLERACQLNIVPNFWLSREYLSIQKDMELIKSEGWIWLQEGEWAVFPPLPTFDSPGTLPKLKIWSDFSNYTLGEKLEFLDWEYVYDANAFLNMRGQQWAVFRKNSRKWPNRNQDNWEYSSKPPDDWKIYELLRKWLEYRAEQEIADSESLVWFVFNGSRRRFLYRKGELLGINIWDENEPYLMYRYCIVDPEEPFLDEFMRWLFYCSVPNRLVIDGGVLDNLGLERFKDKLNPRQKRAIYSRVIR